MSKNFNPHPSLLGRKKFVSLTCLLFTFSQNIPAFGADYTSSDLLGEFQNGMKNYKFEAERKFTLESFTFAAGGDAGLPFSVKGTFSFEGSSLLLHFQKNPSSPPSLPSQIRYYFATGCGKNFLLSENDINGILNSINGLNLTTHNTNGLLRRVKEGQPISIDNCMPGSESLLPAVFKKFMILKPMAGNIIYVSNTKSMQVNAAGWMRPPEIKTQYEAKVTVDLGSNQKVFSGMNLYYGARGWSFTIDEVEPTQSHATIRWINDEMKPKLGTPITSSFFQR